MPRVYRAGLALIRRRSDPTPGSSRSPGCAATRSFLSARMWFGGSTADHHGNIVRTMVGERNRTQPESPTAKSETKLERLTRLRMSRSELAHVSPGGVAPSGRTHLEPTLVATGPPRKDSLPGWALRAFSLRPPAGK